MQELMNGIQEQLTKTKRQQRDSYQDLQREADLHERHLELFVEKLDAPAWTDDAAPDCRVSEDASCERAAARETAPAPALDADGRREAEQVLLHLASLCIALCCCTCSSTREHPLVGLFA